MANKEYVIKQRLDTTDLERGVVTSTAAMEKMANGAKQASQSLRAMFDTPAMEQAKESFAGVSQAVQRFQSAMSKQLPMKRELRETQTAAMALEQAYRGLTESERQSAAGQELRGKIDALIARAGTLRDTMIDVNNAMNFHASDTGKLDAVVGGISALTATAQAAAGAMALLGAGEKEAAEVQKNLMAVMSVTNALQTIQNALQKESALMMGISAARTAAVASVTKLKTAVTAADTIGTKAAAAAQWAWNAAIAANPIGAAVIAIGALAAGIYAYTNRTTEAAQQSRALAEEMKNQSATLAENRIRLKNLQEQWKELTSDKERTQWITANKEEFKKLGVEVRNTADAENLLVNNTGTFIQALTLRAQAAAAAAAAQKELQNAIEKEAEADDRQRNPTGADRRWGMVNVGTDWDFEAAAQREAKKEADKMRSEAKRSQWRAEDYLKKQAELIKQAESLEKRSGVRRSIGTTTNTTTTRAATAKITTNAAKETEKAIQGSINWYDQEIKKLEELARATADVADSQRLFNQARQLENVRDIKFGSVKLTIDKSEFSTRFADDLNKSLAKIKLKPLVLPVFKTDMEIAQDNADTLLDKTKGLRTAAEAASQAFRSMSSAIGGSAGKVIDVAGLMAQAIATMIQGYATATASAGALSPWAWLAFGLSGLAQLMAMIGAVKSAGAFAQGGIVGGASYSGDRQWARVNSGEMILNGQQQANLFNAINTGRFGGGEVTFRIAGRDLQGVLNNHNSKYNKVL